MATDMPQSGTRRIGHWSACTRPFSETRDTVCVALRTPEAKVIRALTMLLVKVALSDIGFVVGVTEATVLAWLRRAAQQAHAMHAHLLRALPVPQVQLDPMGSGMRRKPAQQAGADGRQWVWRSGAPEFGSALHVMLFLENLT
jgi:hypothetical protein